MNKVYATELFISQKNHELEKLRRNSQDFQAFDVNVYRSASSVSVFL